MALCWISLMRKSYDYGHFVVYILTLILFSLSFPNLKADFRRFDQFWSKLGLIPYFELLWKIWKFRRALQKLLGGFNGNSWINMPYEPHVTLFRWPFLSNKAVAVTWVQPKTPSDSFIRSIRVQTWMKITSSRSKSKIHVFDRPVLFSFF